MKANSSNPLGVNPTPRGDENCLYLLAQAGEGILWLTVWTPCQAFNNSTTDFMDHTMSVLLAKGFNAKRCKGDHPEDFLAVVDKSKDLGADAPRKLTIVGNVKYGKREYNVSAGFAKEEDRSDGGKSWIRNFQPIHLNPMWGPTTIIEGRPE